MANTFVQSVDSPNYPSTYPNNQECLWKISSPVAGTIIKLQFSVFKLESGICSQNDYVEVRDGASWSSANPVGVYCGGSVPSTIYSWSRYLLVKFKSDAFLQYRGFQASFKRIVPGTCKQNVRIKQFLLVKKIVKFVNRRKPSQNKNWKSLSIRCLQYRDRDNQSCKSYCQLNSCKSKPFDRSQQILWINEKERPKNKIEK